MRWVVRCWACGRLFEAYAHMVGDQSVCPSCRAEAMHPERRGGVLPFRGGRPIRLASGLDVAPAPVPSLTARPRSRRLAPG